MIVGECRIQADDAPPGFWPVQADADARICGVVLESAVPTRFFQTLDPYPREWGRLVWRVQLNKLSDGRALAPAFRTFYPGIEWNLSRADPPWFLSAWFRWEGAGPPAEADVANTVQIDGDTVLFHVASLPTARIFLRSRVDTRDRHAIAEEVRAGAERSHEPEDDVIKLDDFLGHTS